MIGEQIIIGKRYAKALFELTGEQLEQTEAQLNDLASLFGNDEFVGFFMNPSVNMNKKLEVLTKVLEGKVSEVVFNTLAVMVKSRRIDALKEMVDQYSKLADEHHGRATAIVYTPMKLSEADNQRIAQYFGEITGKQIDVDNQINPALLGGMQVRIGDRLYDGSLSSKLLKLQKILA